ncbi:hypothetical protein [Pedosphaera parvula]|uniref:Uncharacterized protein n=1 Tax=Pedosphaera parvula (strain Ellin514) TaxID=320771 RepID=B9XQG6_PEDPL|nr:hypothetical protein [Pedosphaera parvula]EEF57891.1 hypothetical protein Cflav_PD0841 [Pedosphaera parvula Ellin514]
MFLKRALRVASNRTVEVVGICTLILYVGSYAYLYAHKSPAGNLRYFVYSKGGVEVDEQEHVLYYCYYPIYKIHKWFGGVEHNIDRPKMVFPKDFNG